jgi:hypothetical protein
MIITDISKGATLIFAVTDFFEPFAAKRPEEAIKVESAQGINLAKAAAATPTLKHYIWSTLPNGKKITGGKYIVPHFEAKNQIDAYIKSDSSLLEKTTFVWFTFFASNLFFPMFTPNLLVSLLRSKTRISLKLGIEIIRQIRLVPASSRKYTHPFNRQSEEKRWSSHPRHREEAALDTERKICPRNSG